MAIGMSGSASGGVQAYPRVPGIGQDQWAIMSNANPADPLVGGYAGLPGYGTGQRKISTSPNPTAAIASGAPTTQHWSQVFNLTHNPIGWLLIGLLALWAMHTHAGGLIKHRR